jgi:hypothetical protein
MGNYKIMPALVMFLQVNRKYKVKEQIIANAC